MAKKSGKKARKAPVAPAPLLHPPPAVAPRLTTSPVLVLQPTAQLATSSSSVTVEGGFTGTSGGLFDQHGTGNAGGSARSVRSASNGSLASSSSSATPLPATSITSASPDSRPSTPTPSTSGSALGHLRAQLSSDEASRTAQSRHLKELSSESRKLRKRKPDAGSESSGKAEGGTERTASLYSVETSEARIDEEEVPRELTTHVAIAVVEVIPPSPSPLPALAPSPSPAVKTQTSSEKALILSPAAESNWPLSFLLAGPRYGLSLANSTTSLALRTTKSAISLPFSIAHQLPLIGSHIPSSPFPFSPPTSSPWPDSSFKSPGFSEAQGIVWDAVEVGLGVGLVSIWAAGAGASIVWKTLAGKKGETEKEKAFKA